MNDEDKTREQLIDELAELRQRLTAVASAPVKRQQAYEEFQKGEERFRSLIEHSYDAVVLVDATGTFTYVSPSTYRVLSTNR